MLSKSTNQDMIEKKEKRKKMKKMKIILNKRLLYY